MNPAYSSSLFSTRWLRLLPALLLILALPATGLAQKEERKTKQTVAMSQKVYEKLVEIQELIENQDYAAGHVLMDDLKQSDKLTPSKKRRSGT